MRIIFFSKSDDTPGRRFLRGVLLLLVVGVVVWAYWKNNERRVEMLQELGSISDKTGDLTGEDRSFLKGFSAKLKSEFGMDFKLRAENGPPERPDLDGKTFYVGIDAADRGVDMVLPPLLANALGRDVVAYIQEDHFGPYWDGGRWPEGLTTALLLVWNRLTTLDESSGPTLQGAPPEPPLPPAAPVLPKGPSLRLPVTEAPASAN